MLFPRRAQSYAASSMSPPTRTRLAWLATAHPIHNRALVGVQFGSCATGSGQTDFDCAERRVAWLAAGWGCAKPGLADAIRAETGVALLEVTAMGVQVKTLGEFGFTSTFSLRSARNTVYSGD